MLYRAILPVLLLFMFAASAKSQSFFDGFGVKGGINVATIHEVGDASTGFDFSPKVFFQAGVYKDFWLNLNWSIRAEALYSVKGAENPLQFASGNDLESYERASYLSFPVLAQYAHGNFKFGAGPQFGVLLSDHFFPEGEKMEGVLYDNSFDLGVVGNITYTLLMVDIDLRYVYGLTPIVDFPFPGMGSAALHNGVLQLSLGLRIF